MNLNERGGERERACSHVECYKGRDDKNGVCSKDDGVKVWTMNDEMTKGDKRWRSDNTERKRS